MRLLKESSLRASPIFVNCSMRKRVLLVATEVELRARFARRLQSSGYAVELACNAQRALMLAAEHNFHVAIVAAEPNANSLAMIQQLCDREHDHLGHAVA